MKKQEEKLEKKQEEKQKENENMAQQMLGWFQILMLMGKPLWDEEKKKWRVLNGYQSIIGNQNNMFFEVTFTDTPHWEDFTKKKLYVNIPEEKEETKEDGAKGSDKKGKRTKTENEK